MELASVFSLFNWLKIKMLFRIFLWLTIHNNTISLVSQVLIGPYLIHSVHPPSRHFFLGLVRVSIFWGGCWERGGNLFREWGSFYIQNKLKSEIFNDKKVCLSQVRISSGNLGGGDGLTKKQLPKKGGLDSLQV